MKEEEFENLEVGDMVVFLKERIMTSSSCPRSIWVDSVLRIYPDGVLKVKEKHSTSISTYKTTHELHKNWIEKIPEEEFLTEMEMKV
jgi:hypothetical protein